MSNQARLMIFSLACSSRHRQGFNLIELLVVIAVIVVLAVLLVQSLGRAETAANSVACKENLRQLGLALQLYVSDDGGYPLYRGDWGVSWTAGTDIQQGYWDTRLLPYCAGNRKLFECPSWRLQDTLHSLVNPPDLHAPVQGFPKPFAEWLGGYNFCYGYNAFGTQFEGSFPLLGLGLGGVGGDDSFSGCGAIKAEAIRCPSDMIALGDYKSSFIFLILGEIDPVQASWVTRHPKGAQASFCDGHVESLGRIPFLSDTHTVLPPEFSRRWNTDHEPHPEVWYP